VRSTRREALAGALTGGAALALPALARGADSDDDLAREALSAVLHLEQTALVAYEAIANSAVLKPMLRLFLEQEQQHADQLALALEDLGASPPAAPRRGEIPALPAALGSRAVALRFAITLEERTVAGYQQAIRDSVDPVVTRICAGAMGTDAQQLVVLREAAGMAPVPGPFESGRPR
jgi:rubrerythrin